MEPVRDQMIDQEQPKIRNPMTLEDVKKMIMKTIDELDPEERADPKSHPLEDDYEYQKKKESEGNEERMSGSPFSEENFTIFVLRKNGYIIKDKQVTPPNPLPETSHFDDDAISRYVLRRLGYTFTDEIACLKKKPKKKKKKSTKSKRNEILPEEEIWKSANKMEGVDHLWQQLRRMKIKEEVVALAEGLKAIQTGDD